MLLRSGPVGLWVEPFWSLLGGHYDPFGGVSVTPVGGHYGLVSGVMMTLFWGVIMTFFRGSL